MQPPRQPTKPHSAIAAAVGSALRLPSGQTTQSPWAPATPPARPRPAQFHYELGLTCAAIGQTDTAIENLRRATRMDPNLAAAWGKLGDLLSQAGDAEGAVAAYKGATGQGATSLGATSPSATSLGGNLSAAKIDKAENAIQILLSGTTPGDAVTILRSHLIDQPTDFAALRMLAQLGLRSGQFAAMERLLERALEIAPGYLVARQNYAYVLIAQNKAVQAMPHIDRLLAHDRRDKGYRSLRARALSILGEYDSAIEIFEKIAGEAGSLNQGFWLGYAHTLKYVGRRAESAQAYRNCMKIAPGTGDAYWGIANLKAETFTAAELVAMRTHLAGSHLSPQDRITMHYALGRALEQIDDFAGSFDHYAKGAALKDAEIGWDADARSGYISRSVDFFSAARLAALGGRGCPDPAPIFIVGLPRAGSTLLEQILASHSLVEGTQELPVITELVRDVAGPGGNYPERLADLDADAAAELGKRYIEQSRIYRKTDKPFFIDKMPSNWAYTGFIHLILPHAKIIDARRDGMASCFSAFKQLFGNGPGYSYNLTSLGRFYNDYVGMMAHFDRVLPGRVHRVRYENMVEDAEAEVRRMLIHCGLAFEPACLRFWENKRAVGTPSAEQVRQPIYRDGLNQWRHYEPWLDPLKRALGNTGIQPEQ